MKIVAGSRRHEPGKAVSDNYSGGGYAGILIGDPLEGDSGFGRWGAAGPFSFVRQDAEGCGMQGWSH